PQTTYQWLSFPKIGYQNIASSCLYWIDDWPWCAHGDVIHASLSSSTGLPRWIHWQHDLNCIEGEEVTVSFIANLYTPGVEFHTSAIRFSLVREDGNIGNQNPALSEVLYTEDFVMGGSEVPTRCVATFTVPSRISNQGLVKYGLSFEVVADVAVGIGAIMVVGEVKMEFGGIATQWVPGD